MAQQARTVRTRERRARLCAGRRADARQALGLWRAGPVAGHGLRLRKLRLRPCPAPPARGASLPGRVPSRAAVRGRLLLRGRSSCGAPVRPRPPPAYRAAVVCLRAGEPTGAPASPRRPTPLDGAGLALRREAVAHPRRRQQLGCMERSSGHRAPLMCRPIGGCPLHRPVSAGRCTSRIRCDSTDPAGAGNGASPGHAQGRDDARETSLQANPDGKYGEVRVPDQVGTYVTCVTRAIWPSTEIRSSAISPSCVCGGTARCALV